MLRRRIAILIASSYRWASSKIRMLTGNSANPITAPAEEAESERSIVAGRYARAVNQPTAISHAIRSTLLGRFANPNTYDPAQGISLKRIAIRCGSIAYSVLEAPGKGAVRMLMGRLANAGASITKIANSFRSVVIRNAAAGNNADALEVESAKFAILGIEANVDAADGRDAESLKLAAIGRTSGAISADGMPCEKASGIQNGVYSEGAFWIEPYYEDEMLVIRQAYIITETADRLEVR